MIINEAVSIVDLRYCLKVIIKQCETGKKLSNLNDVLQQFAFIEYLAKQEIKKLSGYKEFPKEIDPKVISKRIVKSLKNEMKNLKHLGVSLKINPDIRYKNEEDFAQKILKEIIKED